MCEYEDRYDMSEDEINPYEGPDITCKNCEREFTPSDHDSADEELCTFCTGDETCSNGGCTEQATVYDKEDGTITANYCRPCWRDLCDSVADYYEFGFFLPAEHHVPF